MQEDNSINGTFLSLEEFLSAPCPENDLMNLEDSEWNLLKEQFASLDNNASLDSCQMHLEPEQLDFAFSTQTQKRILADWKSEYETPKIIRTMQIEPVSPALFGENFEDDEDFIEDDVLLDIPTQALKFSQQFSGNLKIRANGMNDLSPLCMHSSECDLMDDDPFEDPREVGEEFAGFSTAGGKKMNVPSDSALAKAQKILQSVSESKNLVGAVDSIDEITPSFKHTSQKDENFAVALSEVTPLGLKMLNMGFSTAKGKKIESPKKAALRKAESILNELDDNKDPNQGSGINMMQGFSTASGIKIKSPSKEALEKAESLLGKVDETEHLISANSLDEQVPEITAGFSTASGRMMDKPSKEAIEKIEKRLFHDAVEEENNASLVERMKEIKVNQPSPLVRGRPSLKPSEVILKTLKSSPKPGNARPIKLTTPSPLKASVPLAKVFDIEIRRENRKKISTLSKDYLRNRQSLFSLSNFSIKNLLALVKERLSIASESWIMNHLSLIIWKFIAYESMGFGSEFGLDRGTFSVLDQLCYRYEREYHCAQRSILKKIIERDDSPSGYMVLFVSHISRRDNGEYKMTLSDGWYCIEACHDGVIERLVASGAIQIGSKLKIGMAQVMGEEACDALEARDKGIQLKIFGNAVRPAKWHVKLGKQRKSMFTVSLSSVEVDGGLISCLKMVIIRRHPAIYAVEYESGKRSILSQEAMNELLQRQDVPPIDVIVNIRMSVKFRAVDICGSPRPAMATVTIWDSNEDVFKSLEEGRVILAIGLKPSIKKGTNLFLSSHRTSKIIFTPVKYHKELPITPPLSPVNLKSLDPQTDYDLVGRIICWNCEHLWILIGFEEIRVVAVKMAKWKSSSTKEMDLVCLLDVSFLYFDPRYDFPVFFFGEHSQALTDTHKWPTTHRSHPYFNPDSFIEQIHNAKTLVITILDKTS